MNRNLWLGTLLLLAGMLAQTAKADAPNTIVGSNHPGVDLPAVQHAVDVGGKVRLQGTFDFGSGSVVITQDVSIEGETGPHHEPLTTIRGGRFAFFSSPSVPVTRPGPRITIRNLRFDGAISAAIQLAYASDVRVTNNRFSNIHPEAGHAGPNVLLQEAILVGTWRAPLPGIYVPNAITGHVSIADNEMDMTGPSPSQTLCQGVMATFMTAAEVTVRNNHISNCSRNGVEILDNYRDSEGRGEIAIRGNSIITPAQGNTVPNIAAPNGIVAGWFFNPAAANDPLLNPKYVVDENYIETHGPISFGIANQAPGSYVVNNTVVLNNGRNGILVGSADSYIAYNEVSGSTFAGIRVIALTPPASGNVLIGNDVSGLTSSFVDYALNPGTSNTTLIGCTGSVSDLGLNDSVTIGGSACDVGR